MQVDYALILSAGLGTRMGELGKNLPKVLWPIFSKTLLQLQIDYCLDLGISNIYINVHFLAEDIIEHIKAVQNEKVNIIILHEDPLLDSGGAIHNLARRPEVNYLGNVLLINGDQFLFFDKEELQENLHYLEKESTRALLLGISVGRNENYNETILEKNILTEIKKNDGTHDYVTYSGLGVVRLNQLLPVLGPSKFFETVVNYKKEKAYMIVPKHFEYWDFGTLDIYCKNIFSIALNNSTKTLMHKFLERHLVDYKNCADFIDLNLKSIDLDRTGNFAQDIISSKFAWQKI
jgi:mannose-1-phosphate guanylyltransferase